MRKISQAQLKCLITAATTKGGQDAILGRYNLRVIISCVNFGWLEVVIPNEVDPGESIFRLTNQGISELSSMVLSDSHLFRNLYQDGFIQNQYLYNGSGRRVSKLTASQIGTLEVTGVINEDGHITSVGMILCEKFLPNPKRLAGWQPSQP